MRRMDKHENKRERMKSSTIILALLFTTVCSFSYGFFMSRENDRMVNLIKNYDKSAKVYYLQRDLFGR